MKNRFRDQALLIIHIERIYSVKSARQSMPEH